MFGSLARKLFGSANDRVVKGYQKRIGAINALEPKIAALTDDELRGQTAKFRDRLAKGETLDALLEEAFATVREAARRTLGQRHFDVQLIGGMVLHDGRIAEMKTGEGKTLVATLATYLNALPGKGVHVVTVNDYLARRDSEWMGQVYRFLGLSVGCIVHGLDDRERKDQYACDITYGTNNEYGFDYLRDNMKFTREQLVQRPFNFAIVDEVDSILIDEARTPLIISGPAEDSSQLYQAVDVLIPRLEAGDFEKDEKQRAVTFTEAGTQKIEAMLRDAGLLKTEDLYDIENVAVVHHANQALRAHKSFTRDVDYIVKDDKVIIIDEFTGRMMEGRRYSDGLHQALEAKEHVEIQPENQTLASITFQNYFRLYPKLGGMTGTASTEAQEFADIYKLECVEIPTNVTVKRKDWDDEVYKSAREKYDAIVVLIEECRTRGQPALVGTVSIEKSEQISEVLKKKGIRHNVLNARHHEQESYIVAQAGRWGAVTIATNMAGRGTDIQLGGNADMRIRQETSEIADPAAREAKVAEIRAEVAAEKEKVLAAGGLYVIGTERHESRRIDNQLRGRSGRQGDPGASKFFLSLEDDLMRIFGSDRLQGMLQKLGLKEGEAITHVWVTKALEKAQQKVEARNYDIRKNLLRFDDVMNDQRKAIYEQRLDLITTENVSETVVALRAELVGELVTAHIPANAYAEQWKLVELQAEVARIFALDLPVEAWGKEEGIDEEKVRERILDAVERRMAEKAANFTPEVMRAVEKSVLLQLLDQHWKEHLLQLDYLRQAIYLRAYAQKDPLNEYKREAFGLFEGMLQRLKESVTSLLARVEVQTAPPPELEPPRDMQTFHADPNTGENEMELADADTPAAWRGTPRNAPCPCGSGKKFKHCHGRIG